MADRGIIQNRYDFVYLFDCQDGNPNGDPDFGNSPRVDPETLQGLVSDVCLKRKIRDYVSVSRSAGGVAERGYGIFVMPGRTLESQQQLPYKDLQIESRTQQRNRIAGARDWMCRNFFDVRTFGAVMSTTDFNCGQVRGPVQITFARSLDAVLSTDHCITRVTYTKDEKARSSRGRSEMGRKHTIAYGLYRAYGFVNANLAAQTGFNEDDLELLWQALANMFDLERSAARGLMCPRGLYVFRHNSSLGAAHAHQLFERVTVEKKPGTELPRSFSDYSVNVNRSQLPSGVTLLPLMEEHAWA